MGFYRTYEELKLEEMKEVVKEEMVFIVPMRN